MILAEEKKRLNILIDPELHKKLKMAAVKNDTTIVDLVTDAIEIKLNTMNSKASGKEVEHDG